MPPLLPLFVQEASYMATNQHPYLECKNGGCHRTIWLPHSSQLDKSPDRLDSDNQYSEIYVCPVCVHVYDYRRLSVQWRPLRTEDQGKLSGLYAALLEFDCDKERPGTRVVIQKPTTEHRDVDTIVQASASWVLVDVHCRNGHQITALPPKRYGNVWAMP